MSQNCENRFLIKHDLKLREVKRRLHLALGAVKQRQNLVAFRNEPVTGHWMLNFVSGQIIFEFRKAGLLIRYEVAQNSVDVHRRRTVEIYEDAVATLKVSLGKSDL